MHKKKRKENEIIQNDKIRLYENAIADFAYLAQWMYVHHGQRQLAAFLYATWEVSFVVVLLTIVVVWDDGETKPTYVRKSSCWIHTTQY